ncbi:MAG: betB [Cryptosporangiaceae bacterium]|nr:betB [Cryptosporangiaceae bacterium]
MTVTDGRTEAQTGGPTRPRPDPGRLFVDGGWRESAGGGRADLLDPSAGQVVTTVADGNAAAADAAVAAARRAFDEGPWSQTPGRERARVLLRVADGIRRRGDELAAVESIDVGKPITLSRAVDVDTVVEQDEYYAALAQTLDGAARAIPLPPTRYSDPMLPDDVAAEFPGPRPSCRPPLGAVAGRGRPQGARLHRPVRVVAEVLPPQLVRAANTTLRTRCCSAPTSRSSPRTGGGRTSRRWTSSPRSGG